MKPFSLSRFCAVSALISALIAFFRPDAVCSLNWVMRM
jgi:hypothetical protein